MKTRLAVLFLVALGLTAWADNTRAKSGAALANSLNGNPVYLGTLTSIDAGFVDNTTTATPFAISRGACLLTQCDNDSKVYASKTDAGSLATAALAVATGEKFQLGVLQYVGTSTVSWVSIQALDGGTVNCNIYECK
jgi:hypothetical protein